MTHKSHFDDPLCKLSVISGYPSYTDFILILLCFSYCQLDAFLPSL